MSSLIALRVFAYELHIVKKGETFSQIIWGELGSPLYGKNGYLFQHFKLNPQIKNPNRLLPGTKVAVIRKVRAPASVAPVISQVVNDSEVFDFERSDSIEPSRLTTSLGFTNLNYSETGANKYSALMVTPKISYRYRLGQSFDLAANGFFNAQALTSNQKNIQFRTLGLNARLGYQLPKLFRRWAMSIGAGFYYSTTFATGNTFGYKNMMGPQLFPMLVYALDAAFKKSLYLYGKYSPTIDGTKFSFKNNEMAIGLGYNYELQNKQKLTIGLDYSNVKLNFDNVLAINANSLTLSGGLSW